MYVHAGDTIHLSVSASGSLARIFGSDLQDRLQSADVRVLSINQNAVPVTSGYSFGPLMLDVVPQSDFGDLRDVVALVEGAASVSYWIEWGKTTAQVVATAGPSSQAYERLQNSPPAKSPDPIHPPGILHMLGLDEDNDGQPDLQSFKGASSWLLIGAVVLIGVLWLRE